jgi:RNA polymerase sigma-70 factor, ECF subfamily
MAVIEEREPGGSIWAREQSLVRLVCAGDRRAYDELIRSHQDHVMRYAYALTGNADDAVDLAQEVFIQAYQGLSQLRKPITFTAWFNQVMIRVCNHGLRRLRRHPIPISQLQDTEGKNPLEEMPEASEAAPEVILCRREREQRVLEALRRLPTHSRSLLILFHVNSVSYEDLAIAYHLPLGTIKSQLSRARVAFRKHYETLEYQSRGRSSQP